MSVCAGETLSYKESQVQKSISVFLAVKHRLYVLKQCLETRPGSMVER